jgi:hypothetical protein
MPSKVHLAPRHGITYTIFHWIRVTAAFCLAALASYCTTGNFTHSASYQTSQIESGKTSP